METKNNPWMPLYVGDYLKDTQHLSYAEHGAYLRLILFYWNNGGPIPDDKQRLFRAVGAFSPEEQGYATSMLQAFFKHHDGEYHHKRIDAEIARSVDGALKRKAKAFKASKARWGATSNPTSNAPSIPPSNACGNAPAMPYQNQSQNHTSEAIDQNEKPKTKVKLSRKKADIPFPHKNIPDDWMEWALTEFDAKHATSCFHAIKDWALAGGKEKVDWLAAYRGWCRRAHDEKPANTGKPTKPTINQYRDEALARLGDTFGIIKPKTDEKDMRDVTPQQD